MRLQTPLLALVGRDEMPESSSLSLIAKEKGEKLAFLMHNWVIYFLKEHSNFNVKTDALNLRVITAQLCTLFSYLDAVPQKNLEFTHLLVQY